MSIKNTTGDITEVESVGAGEEFYHQGSVLIKGGIGEGAIVKVNGQLEVKGIVEEGAKLKTESSNASNIEFMNHLPDNITIHGGTFSGVTIGNNVSTTNNYSDKSTHDSFNSSSGSNNIILHNVRDNVTLSSAGNIELYNSVGRGLKAKCAGNFRGGSLGRKAYVEAGGNFTSEVVSAMATINADGNGEIGVLMDESIVTVGGDAEVNNIQGDNCELAAGGDINVGRAQASTIFKSGGTTKVKTLLGGSTTESSTPTKKPDFDF